MALHKILKRRSGFIDGRAVSGNISSFKNTKYLTWRRFRAALFILLLLAGTGAARGQRYAGKTNLVGLATLSPNIGIEVAASGRWSFEAAVSYHPWKIVERPVFRHWLAMTEARWWYCHKFTGSFWGLHAFAGQFNVRDLPLTDLASNLAYAGFLSGIGASYGYHLPLTSRLNLELTVGLGYARIDYEQYECKECREKTGAGRYQHFGHTKLGVAMVYFW